MNEPQRLEFPGGSFSKWGGRGLIRVVFFFMGILAGPPPKLRFPQEIAGLMIRAY